MANWPSRKELDRIIKELEMEKGSSTLPPDASPVDYIKHDLCKMLVKLMEQGQMSQRELAEQLEIDEAKVSKIVNYKIEEFTIDRLLKFCTKINPSVRLKVA